MRINTTLLLAGQQQADKQWGRSTAATLNFSLPFQKFYCITTAQESWASATFENTSWIVRTNSSMTWPKYQGTNINYIAVGMQQWGTGGFKNYSNGQTITFPLAMSKVYVCVGTSKNDTGINAGWLSVGTSKLTTSSVVLKNEHNALDAEIHYIVIGQAQQWGATTSPTEDVTYPIPVSRVLCLLLTTRATTFRYSPWPTKITTKSFQAVSDSEPVYWFLVAKQQWGVVPDSRSTLTFLLPFSNADYFYAAFPTNRVTAGGINLHGVRNPNYLELYSSMSNNGYTANNWQFDSRNFNPCWFALGYQQWGFVDDASNYSHTVEFSFTIAFAVKPYIIDLIMALKKESGTNFFYALPISVTNTTAKMYYSGYGSGSNNTRGYYWLAIGF